ncbi:MAG: hypothetical protein ACOC1K_03030, partial [Nanoarchaeota archaeon]
MQNTNLLLQYKSKHPELSNQSDDAIINDLHSKYYKGVDFEEFKNKVRQPFENPIVKIKEEKQQNYLRELSPGKLDLISKQKTMGIIEYGVANYRNSKLDKDLNSIRKKITNNEELNEEEIEKLEQARDFEINTELRGVSLGGKIVEGVLGSLEFSLRSTPTFLARSYLSSKAGAVIGGALGTAVGGPIGTAVGSKLGAVAGFAGNVALGGATAKVNTLLMPDLIDDEAERRIRDKTLGFTDKGQLFFKRISELDEDLERDKARKSIENENYSEALIDTILGPFAKLIPNRVVNSVAGKWIKKANNFLKVPGTTASGFMTEHLEEISVEYLNVLREVDEKKYNEIIPEYFDPENFAMSSATILITGGIMKGGFEAINKLSNSKQTLKDKALKEGIKEEEIKIIEKLTETQADSILEKVQEQETREDTKKYQTKLKDIQKQMELATSKEEAKNVIELYDNVYAKYAYETGLSRSEIIDKYPINIVKNETEAGKARGELKYNDLNATINLFKNQNKSTLLHETGHFFRSFTIKLANESQLARKELDAMNNLVNAKGDNWTRDQEETFARSFEGYLREGKAPTHTLQRVFDSFKQWLQDIYKTIKQLDVNITPEVMDFFDNYLAPVGTKQQFENKYTSLKNDIQQRKRTLQQNYPEFSEDEINSLLNEMFTERIDAVEQAQTDLEETGDMTVENLFKIEETDVSDLDETIQKETLKSFNEINKNITKLFKTIKNNETIVDNIDGVDITINQLKTAMSIAKQRIPKQPLTLTQFIKRKGGIIDIGGELAARDMQGLINKNGYYPDQMFQMVSEAGFLNKEDYRDMTLNDLYSALDEETYGNYFYRPEDRGLASERDLIIERQQEADEFLDRLPANPDTIIDMAIKYNKEGIKILTKDKIKLIQSEIKKAQQQVKEVLNYKKKELTLNKNQKVEISEKIDTMKFLMDRLVANLEVSESFKKQLNKITENSDYLNDREILENVLQQYEVDQITDQIQKELEETREKIVSGKRTGKFDYKTSKFFREIRIINSNSQQKNKELFNELYGDIKDATQLTPLEAIKLRFLNYKTRNRKAITGELATKVLEDIINLKQKGAEAKSEQELIDAINETKNRDEIIDLIGKTKADSEKLSTKQYNKYLRHGGAFENYLSALGGDKLVNEFTVLDKQANEFTGIYNRHNEIKDAIENFLDGKSAENYIIESSKKEYELYNSVLEGKPIKISKSDILYIYNSIKNDNIRESYYKTYG